MITADKELEITCFCVCFHLSLKLQGSAEISWVWDQRYLGAFAVRATQCLSCALKVWFFAFRKAKASHHESQEESKGKFQIYTQSPVVLLQQRKLSFEEHSTGPGPSFSETLTTTQDADFFSPPHPICFICDFTCNSELIAKDKVQNKELTCTAKAAISNHS